MNKPNYALYLCVMFYLVSVVTMIAYAVGHPGVEVDSWKWTLLNLLNAIFWQKEAKRD